MTRYTPVDDAVFPTAKWHQAINYMSALTPWWASFISKFHIKPTSNIGGIVLNKDLDAFVDPIYIHRTPLPVIASRMEYACEHASRRMDLRLTIDKNHHESSRLAQMAKSMEIYDSMQEVRAQTNYPDFRREILHAFGPDAENHLGKITIPPIPDGAVTPQNWGLPPLQAAETYYQLLKDIDKALKQALPPAENPEDTQEDKTRTTNPGGTGNESDDTEKNLADNPDNARGSDDEQPQSQEPHEEGQEENHADNNPSPNDQQPVPDPGVQEDGAETKAGNRNDGESGAGSADTKSTNGGDAEASGSDAAASDTTNLGGEPNDNTTPQEDTGGNSTTNPGMPGAPGTNNDGGEHGTDDTGNQQAENNNRDTSGQSNSEGAQGQDDDPSGESPEEGQSETPDGQAGASGDIGGSNGAPGSADTHSGSGSPNSGGASNSVGGGADTNTGNNTGAGEPQAGQGQPTPPGNDAAGAPGVDGVPDMLQGSSSIMERLAETATNETWFDATNHDDLKHDYAHPGAERQPSEMEFNEVIKELTEDIKKAATSISGGGTGRPSETVTQWAIKELKKSKTHWTRQLNRIISRAASGAIMNGQTDMTYAKRNLNQQEGMPLMMGMVTYAPEYTVLIDASPSMIPHMETTIAECVNIVQSVMRIHATPITFAVADTEVRYVEQSINPFKKGMDQNRWATTYFGGTDLGHIITETLTKGIKYKRRRYPKPQLAIIVTDCLFEWPEPEKTKLPHKYANVIVASTLPMEKLTKGRATGFTFPKWLQEGKNFIEIGDGI